MNVQDLGSIGDLVAAVATLGTLFYLAIQIRQGTRQLRYSSSTDMWSELSVSFDPIYLGENLDLFHRGLADESLEPNEEMGFKFLAFRIFSHFSQIYIHVEDGQLERSVLEQQRGVLVSLYNAPGIRRWWHETAVFVLPREFCDFVESFEEEADALPESAQLWRRDA